MLRRLTVTKMFAACAVLRPYTVSKRFVSPWRKAVSTRFASAGVRPERREAERSQSHWLRRFCAPEPRL